VKIYISLGHAMGSIIVDMHNTNLIIFAKTTIMVDKDILEKAKITLNAKCIIIWANGNLKIFNHHSIDHYSK
jgi:predicted house-cleaning NTP pyrophosphatase (Maf/HAM1 superfamily)